MVNDLTPPTPAPHRGRQSRSLEPKAGCVTRPEPDAKPDATSDNNHDSHQRRAGRHGTRSRARTSMDTNDWAAHHNSPSFASRARPINTDGLMPSPRASASSSS